MRNAEFKGRSIGMGKRECGMRNFKAEALEWRSGNAECGISRQKYLNGEVGMRNAEFIGRSIGMGKWECGMRNLRAEALEWGSGNGEFKGRSGRLRIYSRCVIQVISHRRTQKNTELECKLIFRLTK